jgi:branched-chain amino acid aminotransferase
MSNDEVKYIFFGDELVPFSEAKVHVTTPAMRYGSAVFEGIRGYWNAQRQEMYVFQLREHMERLLQSARLMSFDVSYTLDDLCDRTLETIRKNGLRRDIHIRPLIYLGGTGAAYATGPTSLAITTLPTGRFLDVDNGIRCCVSSWTRISDQVMPPRIKCVANYQNSRLVMVQAKKDNYDHAIILNASGKVSESPAACLFLLRQGQPITPSVTSGILESITRETVMRLLKDHFDLNTIAREVDRTELYVADEAFLCGTAAEVTPVISVDKFDLNGGRVGAVTRELQTLFFRLARGETEEHPEWRTPVYGRRE